MSSGGTEPALQAAGSKAHHGWVVGIWDRVLNMLLENHIIKKEETSCLLQVKITLGNFEDVLRMRSRLSEGAGSIAQALNLSETWSHREKSSSMILFDLFSFVLLSRDPILSLLGVKGKKYYQTCSFKCFLIF